MSDTQCDGNYLVTVGLKRCLIVPYKRQQETVGYYNKIYQLIEPLIIGKLEDEKKTSTVRPSDPLSENAS